MDLKIEQNFGQVCSPTPTLCTTGLLSVPPMDTVLPATWHLQLAVAPPGTYFPSVFALLTPACPSVTFPDLPNQVKSPLDALRAHDSFVALTTGMHLHVFSYFLENNDNATY